jgi:hypothetical protein
MGETQAAGTPEDAFARLSEQGISPVGEVQEYDPGSPERGSGRLQALPLSATEKSSEQPGNGDGIAEKA